MEVFPWHANDDRGFAGMGDATGIGLAIALVLAGCAEGALSPLGPTPSATSGALRLTTDHSAYRLDTPIGVTVTNAGATDVYALDGRSGCAIIQLQQYDSSTRTWISVVGCSQATSPRVPTASRRAQRFLSP